MDTMTETKQFMVFEGWGWVDVPRRDDATLVRIEAAVENGLYGLNLVWEVK
jgi:hypothetical protein